MSALPRQAVVLCAGEGRRLRPLTARTPKPLAPFLNLPILRHTLRALARAGVRRVTLNAWHLADRIEAFAASKPEPALELRVVREPELLGTGGALANLRPLLDPGTLLVLAADVLSDLDLAAFAAAHAATGAAASMALATGADPARFGAVELDEAGRLTDIVGRLGRPGRAAHVNASYHLLEPAVLERLPDGPCCLVRQGYLRWMAAGLDCRGVLHHRAWHETGTPEALLAAQAAGLSGALPVDAALLAEGGVTRDAGAALVHPRARVASDARLTEGTTVAADAVVGAEARLARCLVLPGARIPPGARHRGEILGAGAPRPAEADA